MSIENKFCNVLIKQSNCEETINATLVLQWYH